MKENFKAIANFIGSDRLTSLLILLGSGLLFPSFIFILIRWDGLTNINYVSLIILAAGVVSLGIAIGIRGAKILIKFALEEEVEPLFIVYIHGVGGKKENFHDKFHKGLVDRVSEAWKKDRTEVEKLLREVPIPWYEANELGVNNLFRRMEYWQVSQDGQNYPPETLVSFSRERIRIVKDTGQGIFAFALVSISFLIHTYLGILISGLLFLYLGWMLYDPSNQSISSSSRLQDRVSERFRYHKIIVYWIVAAILINVILLVFDLIILINPWLLLVILISIIFYILYSFSVLDTEIVPKMAEYAKISEIDPIVNEIVWFTNKTNQKKMRAYINTQIKEAIKRAIKTGRFKPYLKDGKTERIPQIAFITHSFGSIIAYDFLSRSGHLFRITDENKPHKNDPKDPDLLEFQLPLFVTMGSPLPLFLVNDRFSEPDKTVLRPFALTDINNFELNSSDRDLVRWHNYYDSDDIIARKFSHIFPLLQNGEKRMKIKKKKKRKKKKARKDKSDFSDIYWSQVTQLETMKDQFVDQGDTVKSQIHDFKVRIGNIFSAHTAYWRTMTGWTPEGKTFVNFINEILNTIEKRRSRLQILKRAIIAPPSET